MLESTRAKLLERLGPDDVVLDVGSWADPFERADWVIDVFPYETRGFYERQGWTAPRPDAGPERFSKETWIQRDVCDREPFPFEDGEVDFAICSHTLEDVRDPVWVCSELQRVAKAGYIEVPSRLEEQAWGVGGDYVGWTHHHWLIDVGPNSIEFVFKTHAIHSRPEYHFPYEFWRSLSDEERVQTLWWEGSFTARERLMRDEPETIAYLSEFVAAEMEARGFERPVQGPSRARLALAHARAFAGSLRARAAAARGRRRGDQASGEFMREFWDARADENALYFVDNTLAYGDVDTARFWAGAERELDALLEPLGARLGRDDDVVEIGCGVGRLTHVIARRAATVRALDVSPRMLDRAREFGRGLGNVEWVLGDGTSLAGIADRSVDACVSHVVFQHIPDPAITLGYVREIGRVLRPGGWAAFQISNDPAIHGRRTGVEGLRIVWRAVRGSGPRGQADPAWLGSYVDLGDLRVAAAECGLEVERVSGEGRQLCFVLVRKIPGR